MLGVMKVELTGVGDLPEKCVDCGGYDWELLAWLIMSLFSGYFRKYYYLVLFVGLLVISSVYLLLC